MMSTLIRILSRWSGMVLGLASLALFWSTRCLSAFPGDSARALVMHLDLYPVRSLESPLFGLLLRLVHRVFALDFLLPLHGLCALGGGLGVWMTYLILMRLSRNRSTEEETSQVNESLVRWISATFAAMLLAVSTPYWMISTRAFPVQVGVLLLLAWVLHSLVLYERRGLRHLYFNVFLFAVGMAEYRSFLLLLPMLGISVLFLLITEHRQRLAAVIWGCFFSFCAGSSLYLLSAYRLLNHATAELLNIHSFGDALVLVVRNQWASLSLLMPQTGWLLVALYTVIPLFLVLIPKRSANRMVVWGSICLHLVLSLIGLMVLLSFPITPWPLLQFAPFLIAPYLCYAVYMGYLAGYWLRVLLHLRKIESVWMKGLKIVAGGAWIPALLTCIIFASLKNFKDVDPRYVQPLQAWSQAVVRDLDDGTFLISGTGQEDLLQLAAHTLGKSLVFISPRYAGKAWYRNYVASLFDDPQLKNLSRVSLSALFQHWMQTEEGVVQRMHSLNYPDLFYAAGFQPRPEHWGYSGQAAETAPIPAPYLQAQEAFWDAPWTRGLQPGFLPEGHVLTPVYALLRRESARRMNDLGVYLQEQDALTDAAVWYQRASACDPANLSAILNGYALQQRESSATHDWTSAYEALSKEQRPRMHMWQLAQTYGYVHRPQMYVSRGLSWALTGKPQVALNELRRAEQLTGASRSMHLTLADFFFRQEDLASSQRHFLQLLSENPNDAGAVQGLFRIAASAGRYDQARSFLMRLRALVGPGEAVTREELALRLMEEDYDSASGLLKQLRDAQPDDVHLALSQLVLALQAGDAEQQKQAEGVLQRRRYLPTPVALAYSDLLLMQGRAEASMAVLSDALQLERLHPQLLDRALRLAVRMGDRTLSMQLVPLLLEINPTHAYANLVLGSDRFHSGEYALAEASFNTALQAERSVEALNSLAFVQQVMGRPEQALPLVEEALELSPLDPHAWDTLGVILFRLRSYERAEQALRKSLDLNSRSDAVYVHLAQVQAAQGHRDEAAQLIRELLAKSDELDPALRKDLLALQDLL